MIFYSDKNVYEAGKDRIRWIFDEFAGRNIVVAISGGKDSTALLFLVKEVMDERGIKKIPVFFLDQELEAPQTIEYIRYIMHLPWVEPYWIQSYFQEWNASAGKWFNVWGKGEKWAREKEPDNPYTDVEYPVTRHFKEVLHSVLKYHFGEDYINLGGVRVQESPARRIALTKSCCYKDVSWGKAFGKDGKKGLVLYPLWDWSTNDIWYYIFSNHIKYCSLYNYQFTKKPLTECRVSSFIHENSIKNLREIKEIAPEFYEAAVRRVENVNTTVQSYAALWDYIGTLPPYFSSWAEYIEYLADNLTEDPKNAEKIKTAYQKEMANLYRKCGVWKEGRRVADEKIGRTVVLSILSEDFELSKVRNEGYRVVQFFYENYGEIKKANRGNAEWCWR